MPEMSIAIINHDCGVVIKILSIRLKGSASTMVTELFISLIDHDNTTPIKEATAGTKLNRGTSKPSTKTTKEMGITKRLEKIKYTGN